MPTSRKDRAVEVECHPSQLFGREPVEHQIARHGPAVGDRLLVLGGEWSADGRQVGQAVQTEDSLDHRIVVIVVAIAQLAVFSSESVWDSPSLGKS
jgi:hypothetical protein